MEGRGTDSPEVIESRIAKAEYELGFTGQFDKVVVNDDLETKEKIREAAERLGVCSCILCENLQEAVKICAEKAQPGEAVLLSPACASWGQFDNYEQRGDCFKEYVKNL